MCKCRLLLGGERRRPFPLASALAFAAQFPPPAGERAGLRGGRVRGCLPLPRTLYCLRVRGQMQNACMVSSFSRDHTPCLLSICWLLFPSSHSSPALEHRLPCRSFLLKLLHPSIAQVIACLSLDLYSDPFLGEAATKPNLTLQHLHPHALPTPFFIPHVISW